MFVYINSPQELKQINLRKHFVLLLGANGNRIACWTWGSSSLTYVYKVVKKTAPIVRRITDIQEDKFFILSSF